MERSAANAENPSGHDQEDDLDEGYRAVDTALETNPSSDVELLADAAANARAIAYLIDQLGQSIVDKFRPAEDRLANSDGDIQGLNKTGCRSQEW